jgi:hypothetical protein
MTELHAGHEALIAEFPALEGVQPESPEWFQVWESEHAAKYPGDARALANIRSRAQHAQESE